MEPVSVSKLKVVYSLHIACGLASPTTKRYWYVGDARLGGVATRNCVGGWENMERQDFHFCIVISCVQTDSNEALTKTCESALKYHLKEEHLVRFGIWCINCPSSLVEHA